KSDVAGLQIELLSRTVNDSNFQIDDAVLAEACDARSGLRIERNQAIPGGDVDDSFLFAVGPIRQSASRQLTRRVNRSLAFELGMHPHKLAGVGLERDY